MFFYITSLRAPSADGVWTDIAGEYSLSLIDVHGEAIKGYPFLDMDMARTGGTVVIAQETNNSVVFLNQMENGRHMRKPFIISGRSNLLWKDGCLVHHERKTLFGGIFFGWSIQSITSVLKKDVDGNLQVRCTQEEKGLVLFLLPFSDHHQSSLLLRARSPISKGKSGVASGYEIPCEK
ncbi:MAG: hypothetical protein GX599_08250 [Chloroflexi bacterium]|nr:hypothetical protein [Chloroflexota bacterium]